MGLNNLLACSFESNYIIEQFDNGNLIRMLMGFTWFPIGFYHLQYEKFSTMYVNVFTGGSGKW